MSRISALPLMTDSEIGAVRPADEDERSFGSLSTDQGHLPLKAMDVDARLVGLVAHTTLEQTFVNTHDEPLEATYIFPLPSRAAVRSFQVTIAGRTIEGVLKERAEARQEYDQAIADGHRAAITEEERPGVFTMRVGNLMPGEQARVRLEMVGPLTWTEGEVTWQFPLVVAPRYIPGTPLDGEQVGDGVALDTDAVPDASRISPPVLLPGYPNPVQLALAVTVDPAGMPMSDLRSSLHTVVRPSDDSTAVRLQPGERLNRDFILRYQLGGDEVSSSLLLEPDADRPDASEGTFAITLVPPAANARSARARSVVFILDRSGSMGGWKMVAARRAMARMVDTLTDRDRFAVYAFDNTVETPPGAEGPHLMAATDRNRFRAVEFLAGVDARGGTEMATPLMQGAQVLREAQADTDKVLVLVTDGQVGNEDQILRSLKKDLKNMRVFTLGVDRAVNEGFLKRLAEAGGGQSELVESEERLDEVMDRLHRLIAEPVLTDVTLESAQGISVDTDSVVPRRLPDLFTGTPVVISGRYGGAPEGAIEVKARFSDGSAWTQRLGGEARPGTALTGIWARHQVRALEDDYVLGHGDTGALEKRIVEISLTHKVLCRFTAFVAVDRSEVVNPGGEVHSVTQPVDAPSGWDMVTGSRSMPAPAAAAPGAPMMQALGRGGGGKKKDRKVRAKSAVQSEEMRVADLEAGCEAPADAPDADDAGILEPHPPTEPTCDVAALIERMESAPTDVDARLKVLGELLPDLDELLHDLWLVGDRVTHHKLDLLIHEVQRLKTSSPKKRQVDSAWRRVLEMLESVAPRPTEAGRPARKSFWK